MVPCLQKDVHTGIHLASLEYSTDSKLRERPHLKVGKECLDDGNNRIEKGEMGVRNSSVEAANSSSRMGLIGE